MFFKTKDMIYSKDMFSRRCFSEHHRDHLRHILSSSHWWILYCCHIQYCKIKLSVCMSVCMLFPNMSKKPFVQRYNKHLTFVYLRQRSPH